MRKITAWIFIGLIITITDVTENTECFPRGPLDCVTFSWQITDPQNVIIKSGASVKERNEVTNWTKEEMRSFLRSLVDEYRKSFNSKVSNPQNFKNLSIER